jgi:hypothetical protein
VGYHCVSDKISRGRVRQRGQPTGSVVSYVAALRIEAVAGSRGVPFEAIGQDGVRVIALATSVENKERLRRETETAWDLGIFGAPTCVVGGELFWGNDRMDDALDWYITKGGGPCPST